MLRMFVGADTDLFHCVDAWRSMGREKAFGSALAPSLCTSLTTVPEVVIVLAAEVRMDRKHGDGACFQPRICFV
jgi:hypothetical protein